MSANLGYRSKGQNEVPPHQSSGERKNRAACREESAEDREEQTEEMEQPWDKIWTRGAASEEIAHMPRGSRGFVTVHYPFRCSVSGCSFCNRWMFHPVKKNDLPVRGLAVHKNRKTRKRAFMKEILTSPNTG